MFLSLIHNILYFISSIIDKYGEPWSNDIEDNERTVLESYLGTAQYVFWETKRTSISLQLINDKKVNVYYEDRYIFETDKDKEQKDNSNRDL